MFVSEDWTALTDYKVYCFHGEPMAILVMHGRDSVMKTEFFDCEWKPLEENQKYGTVSSPTPKPKCFEKMLEYAKRLSKPFPFVRCDFFIIKDKLYFGELTFTPAAGFFMSQTKINGKNMEEYLHIK